MRTTLLVAVLTFTGQAALAEYEGISFGDQGVLAPSGVIGFDYTSTNIAGISGSAMTLHLSPRLMYFLSDGFALGGDLSLLVLKMEGLDAATSFGIGPRVGYNIPLRGSVSWFPNLGVQLVTGGGVTRLPLDIEAPFLIHFGNFFIGIGPALVVDIWGKLSTDAGQFGEDSSGYRQLIFRISVSFGGWIPTGGGDWDDVMPPPDETPREPPPVESAPPAESAPPPADPAPADEEDEWT